MKARLLIIKTVLVSGVVHMFLSPLVAAGPPEDQGNHSGRLPGELEPQHGLLLSCHEVIDRSPQLFVDLVSRIHSRMPVVALVNHAEQYRHAKTLLRDHAIPLDTVRFAEVAHDTMWVRDYGPMILESESGSPIMLDAGYSSGREQDDRLPAAIAPFLNIPRVPFPFVVEGGNLLTNGNRLGVMTGSTNDESISSPKHYEHYLNAVERFYGFEEVVVLEPLIGEPTGHVDMFATFPSAHTVIVGSYTQEEDAENAALLDRNAALLAEVTTEDGPLRVIRIPMPTHRDGIWRTFTNVIYANGLVLIPIYPQIDTDLQREAFDIFKAALPGWQVDGVDASEIIESSGALHCMTMNLGPIGPLPVFPEPRLEPEDDSEFLEDIPQDYRLARSPISSSTAYLSN
ncbi:MAG: hypothetical protein GWQ05_09960 [Verrucomicrobiaceae bacterium]|nr:hypothetical protein [Verrucomicrobiaceae bacterium]